MNRLLTSSFFLFALISCDSRSEKNLAQELQKKKNEFYSNEKTTKSKWDVYREKQSAIEELEREEYRKKCKIYYALLDSLNAISYQYFYDSVLTPAVYSDNVSIKNKEFLSELNEYLRKPWRKKIETPAFQNILFALFQLDMLPLSITSYPKYGTDNGNLVRLDFESKFIRNSESIKITNADYWQDSIPFMMFPSVVEEIYDGLPLKLYSMDGKDEGKIINFGTTLSECESYAFYPISTDLTKSIPLIGSTLTIDLDFLTNSKLDSLISSSISPECFDCPSSTDNKVFAKIKGVENLYFTYTNTSPTPSRSLMLKIENHFISLWTESIDQFGCSCL